MSENVQFDTDMQSASFGRPRPQGGFGQPTDLAASGMAGWLLRHGWVKSPAAAQRVLVGIIVVDIIAMFIIIKFLVL